MKMQAIVVGWKAFAGNKKKQEDKKKSAKTDKANVKKADEKVAAKPGSKKPVVPPKGKKPASQPPKPAKPAKAASTPSGAPTAPPKSGLDPSPGIPGGPGVPGQPGQPGQPSPFPPKPKKAPVRYTLSPDARQTLEDYKRGHTETTSINDSLVDKAALVTDIKRNIILSIIEDWRYSSNGSPTSCLLQKAAVGALGAKTSDWQTKQFKLFKDEDATVKSAEAKALLKKAYLDVQEDLKKSGLDPEDEITLYRGMYTDKRNSNYTADALESWSLDESVVNTFSKHCRSLAGTLGMSKPGVVVSAQIPAKDILSVNGKTWLGEAVPNEVVVIGRGKRNVIYLSRNTGSKQLPNEKVAADDYSEDEYREVSEDWLRLVNMAKSGRQKTVRAKVRLTNGSRWSAS